MKSLGTFDFKNYQKNFATKLNLLDCRIQTKLDLLDFYDDYFTCAITTDSVILYELNALFNAQGLFYKFHPDQGLWAYKQFQNYKPIGLKLSEKTITVQANAAMQSLASAGHKQTYKDNEYQSI